MKAVIYARYSSDNQREESIEGQLRECMAYCKKNDITVLRTYIDRAMSAKTDHRPDFQRMIKDSAKGLFDVIIVWKLDRFARNRYDSAHYKAQLRKYGVKVLSATENISDGPEGIILESMLEGMAEYYSAELSEKVIRGHTENALKCKYNGGTPTFGYIIDKDMQYQIDPCTAPAVLEMFTMYDKGATMKEIVAYMSERGVTTVRGKKIDLNFMARLLKNRKYIGEYSYRHIVTPNGIPAIVPQDLFDRVQQRLAVNRKAPARHKAEDDYLLTTKLFCGTCGAMMVGESGTSSSKGRKYHYYRCVNTKKHRACDAKHKTVRKLPLENAVVNAVMAKIMDDNFAEYVADAVMDIQSRESSVLPALRKQLEEAESGITNMLNAIQMGIINASTKQRLDELEERKKDIELQIIQEEMKHPAVSREDVIYFVCRFRSLDTSKLDARRRLIDSFVNAVTIFDDYILITFNYKEGETRIDFADIESSDLQSVGGPKRKTVKCQSLHGFSCIPNGLRLFFLRNIRSVLFRFFLCFKSKLLTGFLCPNEKPASPVVQFRLRRRRVRILFSLLHVHKPLLHHQRHLFPGGKATGPGPVGDAGGLGLLQAGLGPVAGRQLVPLCLGGGQLLPDDGAHLLFRQIPFAPLHRRRNSGPKIVHADPVPAPPVHHVGVVGRNAPGIALAVAQHHPVGLWVQMIELTQIRRQLHGGLIRRPKIALVSQVVLADLKGNVGVVAAAPAVPPTHIPGQGLIGTHRAVRRLADHGVDAGPHAALIPVPAAGCAQPPVIRGEIPPEPRVVGPRAVDHHPTGPDGPSPKVTVVVGQQGLVQPH